MASNQTTDLDLFKSEWTFTRGLTIELLDSFTDAELGQTPCPSLGPFWKQFRHVGRLQECYQEALNSKRIKFDYENKHYRDGCSKDSLKIYLQYLDRELIETIESLDWRITIDWDGNSVGVFQHLLRMHAHEILHHGQWILYTRLMGKMMPPSWKAWGV
jgi:uncharacterized damage-inducible protein DinB